MKTTSKENVSCANHFFVVEAIKSFAVSHVNLPTTRNYQHILTEPQNKLIKYYIEIDLYSKNSWVKK